MKTGIQVGNILSLTAPAGGVVSGVPVIINDITVVPATDAAVGLPFEGAVEGVYEVPKTTPEVWAEGEKIYWDPGTSKATNVVGALFKMGVVAKAAVSAATVGNVKLER
jgi:predicted RecA/RadA family phage recombinase